jgi:hypothetical protein
LVIKSPASKKLLIWEKPYKIKGKAQNKPRRKKKYF